MALLKFTPEEEAQYRQERLRSPARIKLRAKLPQGLGLECQLGGTGQDIETLGQILSLGGFGWGITLEVEDVREK